MVLAQEGLFVGGLVVIWLLFAAIGIAGFVFWIFMLIDVVQLPEGWFKSGTKTTWLLVVILAGGLGAIIYFFAARPPPEVREYLKQWRSSPYPPPPAFGYPIGVGYYPPPPQYPAQQGYPQQGYPEQGYPPEGYPPQS